MILPKCPPPPPPVVRVSSATDIDTKYFLDQKSRSAVPDETVTLCCLQTRLLNITVEDATEHMHKGFGGFLSSKKNYCQQTGYMDIFIFMHIKEDLPLQMAFSSESLKQDGGTNSICKTYNCKLICLTFDACHDCEKAIDNLTLVLR